MTVSADAHPDHPGGGGGGQADRSSVAATVMEVIMRRRSRRNLDGSPVARAALLDVLRAGLAAPSSKDARPWALHVVEDRSFIRDIAELAEKSPGADTYVPRDPATGIPRPNWPSTVSLSAETLRRASTAIFIENLGPFSGGRARLAAAATSAAPDALVGYTFEVIGLGAAIENMWLVAEAHGVAASFVGDIVIAETEVARRLGMAGDFIGVLALGGEDVLTPMRDAVRSDPEHSNQVFWHESSPLDRAVDR